MVRFRISAKNGLRPGRQLHGNLYKHVRSRVQILWQHVNKLTGVVHGWEALISDYVIEWVHEMELSCPHCHKDRQERLMNDISRDM